jgi:hypothetical protein
VLGALKLVNFSEQVISSFHALFDIQDFHPHGLHVYNEGEKEYLFVVNHRRDAEAVAVFLVDLEHDSLVFQWSLTHPLFFGLNDILPITLHSFYVTNWLRSEPGTIKAMFENLSHQPVSSVAFCSGNTCRLVVESLTMANGIASSPDLSTVYVVETIAKRVGVYSRDSSSNDLTPVEYLPTVTFCDNIERSTTDPSVFHIGCHPKTLSLLIHSIDPSIDAPSQVLELRVGATGRSLRALYYNDGSQVSASSSALVLKNRLYVGNVYRDGVLSCKLE